MVNVSETNWQFARSALRGYQTFMTEAAIRIDNVRKIYQGGKEALKKR